MAIVRNALEDVYDSVCMILQLGGSSSPLDVLAVESRLICSMVGFSAIDFIVDMKSGVISFATMKKSILHFMILDFGVMIYVIRLWDLTH